MIVTLSFRARILLVVVLVALVPLGLVGLWLTGSAGRSGDTLLRGRLADGIEATVERISDNWVRKRSELLGLASNEEVREQLRSGETRSAPVALARDFVDLDDVVHVAVSDRTGNVLWTLDDPVDPVAGQGRSPTGAPTFRVRFEIWDSGLSDRRLGWLDVRLRAGAVLQPGSQPPEAAGMVVGLFDAATGTSLIPVSFDPLLLDAERFQWGGETWLTDRRSLSEPPVTVVVAATMSPFTRPFEDAARRGAALLLGVALVGVVLAILLTRRLTGSLENLSEAATAVSAGDFGRRVSVDQGDEVGRVAEAFNTMTTNLERTLAELAGRESLAAVGQFAASLAHEIRNPLIAIRIDLQRVRQVLPEGTAERKTHERALEEIVRLDQTVTKTLRAARHAGVDRDTIDLREPVRAAAAAARPELDAHDARLSLDLPDMEVQMQGDGGALEQLFLNLIQNAAQSLARGGEVRVRVSLDGRDIVASIADDGAGIPPDLLERVFDPLFTTRSEGTGLGLTIARRIAEAHGGSIAVESESGAGTRLTVRLPSP
jgi:signal transduction histidine kinase